MYFKLSNPLVGIFSILILFSTLYSAASTTLKMAGFISIIVLLSFNLFFIYFYMTLKNKFNLYKNSSKTIIWFSLYIIWIFIGILYSFQPKQGIQILVLSVFYLSLIVTFSNIKLTIRNKNIINFVVFLFFIINFVYVILFYNTSRFSFYFSNPNSYAAFIYYLMFLFVLTCSSFNSIKYLKTLLVVITTISVSWFTQSMTMVLSMLISLMIILLWNRLIANKYIFKSMFYLVVITITAFTYLYPLVSFDHSYDYINQIFLEYTGQRFYSGRNKVWFDLIQMGSLNNWFGYGTGILPKDLFRTELSAHNLYLQIYIQNGLIGLMLLFFILKSIWTNLYNSRHNKNTKYVTALFIGIMIHQTFEVTLLQNSISIGSLQWMLIAIGLNLIKKNEADEK